MLKHLPTDERPRERLMQKGPAALSSIELLAILLGTGTQKRSVLDLAADLLGHFGSLEQLADASLQELQTVPGIGEAKALQLQAAFALWRRTLAATAEKPVIDSPLTAFAHIQPDIQNEKTEVLGVMLRDVRRTLVHKEIVARGTLDQVIMHPREVFCSAIRHRAHSVIVVHNHPSGDPTPSDKDVEITSMLRAAGQVIGIPLIDHLIVGRSRFFSFRERGIMCSPEGY